MFQTFERKFSLSLLLPVVHSSCTLVLTHNKSWDVLQVRSRPLIGLPYFRFHESGMHSPVGMPLEDNWSSWAGQSLHSICRKARAPVLAGGNQLSPSRFPVVNRNPCSDSRHAACGVNLSVHNVFSWCRFLECTGWVRKSFWSQLTFDHLSAESRPNLS